MCANDLKYLEFEHFLKTKDIKKLEPLLEQNHHEQNQTNRDSSETTTTAEIKHTKSKPDRALRSWSFKCLHSHVDCTE